MKRAMDILCSVLALIVLGLPMLLIALILRCESRGPALFRQTRAGWRGRPFPMLKFRTMRTDVDPYGVSPHSKDDPRLTRFGRFLREKSLDELPQLLNILAGHMSVVGPRPLYERQAALWNERQRHRLDVRPGLTGYAQAYGRGSLPIEDKIEMDLYYVEHQSFWLDAKIVVHTATGLFRKGTIYEQQYSREKTHEINPDDKS